MSAGRADGEVIVRGDCRDKGGEFALRRLVPSTLDYTETMVATEMVRVAMELA